MSQIIKNITNLLLRSAPVHSDSQEITSWIKPFSEEEFVQDCILKGADIVCPKEKKKKLFHQHWPPFYCWVLKLAFHYQNFTNSWLRGSQTWTYLSVSFCGLLFVFLEFNLNCFFVYFFLDHSAQNSEVSSLLLILTLVVDGFILFHCQPTICEVSLS